MKNQAYILIFLLTMLAGKAEGQACVSSLTSGASTDNQTVCINNAITSITYSTDATGAVFSGLPTGVSGSFTAPTVTIIGTPSVAGTFNYTVTLSACTGTLTGTIIIKDTPTASAGAGIAAICQSGTTVALGGSFGGTATSAIWSASVGGGSFSGNGGSTPGSATYTAASNSSTPVTLTLTTNTGTCGFVTDSKQLVVNPLPVPVITGPAPACIASTGNTYSTEAGMTNYVWNVSSGGSITSGGGSTDNSVTVTWTSIGAKTVSVNYKNGNNCTGAASTIYNVNVIAKPAPTNVLINGVLKQYVTLNVSYDYVPGPCFPEDPAQTEISWYRANNAGGSSSAIIVTKPGTDKSYTLAAADVGKYIQVRVKLHDGTVLMSAVSSANYIGPVAANDVPSAGTVSFTGTLEVNSTLTGSYNYSDSESDPEGATVIEWYRANNSSGSGATKISGATTISYTLTNTEKNKYIQLRVTPVASSGSTPGSVATSTSWAGPVTDLAPVASIVTISGVSKVNSVLTGHYQYSDAEGDLEGSSVYQWYTGTNASGAGSAPIGSTNSISYIPTNSDIGKFIGFSVSPVAQSGATPGLTATSATWSGPVTNPKPVATSVSITGILNVNSAITGHYIYSDAEGDLESGSSYRWFSSSTLAGPYLPITGETGISHVIAMGEQGYYFKFEVTPKTITGTLGGDPVLSSEYGRANSKPFATLVSISPQTTIGSTLTGSYTYNDNDLNPQGVSTFRWLRNLTTPIPGATGITYLLKSDDEGSRITFEVTPVSSAGFPDTGSPATSSQTGFITDPSVLKPLATEVCIEGVRAADSTLKGKYYYDFYKSEGSSTFKWIRNGLIVGTGLTYTLTQADIDSKEDFVFEVTPVSSNIPGKTGLPVVSNPLARITLPQDKYSVAVSEVLLTSNEIGGVFSGPGVTNGKFSPSAVGIVGSPYTISYLLTRVKAHTTCSQKAYEKVQVETNTASFSGINTAYCKDGATDIISVIGYPGGAISKGFTLTDIDAIVGFTDWTVTIDPKKMNAGVNKDILSFKYNFGGYDYSISQSLIIDSVGVALGFININSAYCAKDAVQTVSVVGLYPSGGVGTWTGDLLLNKTNTAADLDPKSVAAGATYPVSYSYVSPRGCFSIPLSKPVTINPLPDPNFALDLFYNVDGPSIVLVPLVPGGTFSGNGVSGNRLFPAIAGLGEHTIKYTLRDVNLCSDYLDLKTTIKKAEGNFLDLPPVICYRDTTFNVKVVNIPPSATVNYFVNSKKSITHIPNSRNVDYYVPDAGPGPDTLSFSYKFIGVNYVISTVVNIDSLGQVTIGNLLPGDVICNNVSPFELFTTYKGGVFTGPVVGGYLDPTKALGSSTVSYKYTNQKTGCSTAITIPFTIIPAPVITFSLSDNCIEGATDLTRFTNTTASASLINDWLWEFVEPGGSKYSNEKDPAFLYKTGGLHTVNVIAKTTSNCSVTKTSSFNLGVKPEADFYWKKECLSPLDSLMLHDNTKLGSSISSRTWNFFDGNALQTDTIARYKKTTAGYITVRYIVNTSYTGCSDTVTKNIYIRPNISLATDDYFENFEAGNGGWVKYDEAVTGWTFGKPNRIVINSASSGNNTWFTPASLTTQKIQSSVISPCFDFSVSERPMINMKMWKRFDRDRDGAALQYKVGDEPAWQTLGTLDDGILWYNSTLIKGSPGGTQVGWTTKGTPDTKWMESRHTMDELKGEKDVKFRITYGSDGNATETEGMAIDDIWIGERTRNVLIEHFTNNSSVPARDATSMVNGIVNTKDRDVINIQYHTNFPGSDDPFYSKNPGESSARTLFYGLIKTPYTFIDGGSNKPDFANRYDYILADIDSNDVTRRSLITPKFDISISSSVTGGVLTVSGMLTALEDISTDNLTLYIAVTEKVNNKFSAPNGETKFYNVFRKFIPDAGGISVKKTWTKGESKAIGIQTWIIEKTLNSSDIEVIAFVQNSVTKDLFQAVSEVKTNLTVGIEKFYKDKGLEFSLYPNPATTNLSVRFGEALKSDADIKIYDLRGTVVRSYKAGSGESEFSVDGLGLSDGIYLVRISSGGIDHGYKKLVIAGN